MGFLLALNTPASPSLGFLDDSFALKRFQQNGGVARFPKERRNRVVRDRQYDDNQLKKEE
jgi:hypothetical protein